MNTIETAPRRTSRTRPRAAWPGAPENVETLRRALGAQLPPRPSGVQGDPLEARSRRYLQGLRWPDAIECPRCGESNRLLWLEARSRWNCYGCRYQFSVTAGTLFHASHLAVWKWLVAVRLMTEHDGISANELLRLLGGSYKTWWFTTHRIRIAIAGVDGDGALRRIGAPTMRTRSRGDRYRVAYMRERQWRAANAGNPDVFRETVRALLNGNGVSYDELTGQPAPRAESRARAA